MIFAWVIFIGFVLLMLALDLGVFHRKSHAVGFKEAIGWSAVWISLGLAFSLVIKMAYDAHWFGLGMAIDAVDGRINDGQMAMVKYLTGYVVEKSLSVDNIFVIAMVFGSLAVPARYQHRVLFWGILGALVMRGVMIGAGAALIARFHWILWVFGAFLIFTALKMFFTKDDEVHPENSRVVKWTRRFFPVTSQFHGQHFIVKAGSKAAGEAAEPGKHKHHDAALAAAKPGVWLLTPLMISLILVEVTDLIFAVDSIPAIFAITADPFLVFTSNVFAILGLRSLYFALAGMIQTFHLLKPALALVLAVVGTKMIFAKQFKALLGENTNVALLGVVLAIIIGGVVASLLFKPKPAERD